MIIVLDTNVYVQDLRLTGANFRVLLEGFANVGHELVVPEIIFDETSNKYAEEVREQSSKSIQLLEKLSRLSGKKFPHQLFSFDVDNSIADYKLWLRARLSRVGAKWLSYPTTDHKTVVRRALERRRPFNKEGRVGYRDALIWESILELLKSRPTERVALVSENPKDFAADDKKTLHPDLVADLTAQGLASVNVELHETLEAFNELHIVPALAKADDVARKIAAGTFQPFNLKTWAESNLQSLLRINMAPSDLRDLQLPRHMNLPHIESVFNTHVDPKPVVRLLSNKEYLIEFEVAFSALISGYDFSGVASPRSYSERMVDVTSDSGDAFPRTTITVHAGAHIQLTIDDAGAVISTELQGTWSTAVEDENPPDDTDEDYDGGDDNRGRDVI